MLSNFHFFSNFQFFPIFDSVQFCLFKKFLSCFFYFYLLGLPKEPTWMRIFGSTQALSPTIATFAIRAFRKKAIWRSIVVSIRARGHLSANNAEPASCVDPKWLCTTVSFIQAKGPINVPTVPKTSNVGT